MILSGVDHPALNALAGAVANIFCLSCPVHYGHQTCYSPHKSSLLTNASVSFVSPARISCFIRPVMRYGSHREAQLETVSLKEDHGVNSDGLLSSCSAVAMAIQKSSTSPVEFVQMIESIGPASNLVLPSPDFGHLCSRQLELFRRIVHPKANLSVYVRPAGGYVIDRLELRRVTCYPEEKALADMVILIGNFTVPTGLRATEAAFSSQPVQFLPENRALVFPMIKPPFVVGFLVAEFPFLELEENFLHMLNQKEDLVRLPSVEESCDLSLPIDGTKWSIRSHDDNFSKMCQLSTEQLLRAIDISSSLAMAYVMDQKAMLLQQTSWQNNVRMRDLVEQIRGPFSSIRTLSKMLSTHVKRNEIASDIVENILVQGDHINDALQELQDAVFLTKANIMRYNEETLKRLDNSEFVHSESVRHHVPDSFVTSNLNKLPSSGSFLNTSVKDLELPMPPLTLAPLRRGIRPCNVSEVLKALVDAVKPLALKQRRDVFFTEHPQSVQVSIEEPALRQALSNLIEGSLLRTNVGGKIEIISSGSPSLGALVVIDDDGPDMHFMTQMHSLTPFGADLSSKDMIEDNMTWNFVAGLTVAREILESYGCVLRIISPLIPEGAAGSGGTRIELWLPSLPALSETLDLPTKS